MRQTIVSLGSSQADSELAGQMMRDYFRQVMRNSLLAMMAEEVRELCGARHRPDGGAFRRAGSGPGVCLLEGRREHLRRRLLLCLAAGVSSRDQRRLHPGAGGISRSSVSRLWVKEGLRQVEALRGRELAGESFIGLFLDGVALSEDQTAVVALGLTADGRKLLLDFELGGSENQESCDRLLDRLGRRGLRFCCRRPLIILDGSLPLRRSVLLHYPRAVIQRCLVHKERNLRGCLSRRHHGRLGQHFKRLRLVS